MHKEVILLALVVFSFTSIAAQDLNADSLFIKVSVSGQDLVTRSVFVNSQSGGDFVLNLLDLEGVSLSKESFSLEPGQTEEITLNFNPVVARIGPRVGSLEVIGGGEKLILPIVFEVESENLLFDLNLEIPINYLEVAPGERVLAHVKIFDLFSRGIDNGLGPTNLDIEYFVYDLSGEVITSQIDNVLLEGEAQISKGLVLPLGTAEGDYVLVVKIDNKGSVAISSRLFSVKDREGDVISYFDELIRSDYAWIAFVIVAFFFILFLILLALVRSRNKAVSGLRRSRSRYASGRRVSQSIARKKKAKEKKKDDILEKIEKTKIRSNRRVRELRRQIKK